MSNSDILVTAIGWAATDPREVRGDGVPYTDFRLGHTSRRFDGTNWVDGQTVWFTVKSFRDLARNVAESVKKGLPVVVHGRLRTETWQGKDGERTTVVIEATSVGLNLSWGVSDYRRRVYRGPEGEAAEPQAGERTGEEASAVDDAGAEPTVDPWAVDAEAAAPVAS